MRVRCPNDTVGLEAKLHAWHLPREVDSRVVVVVDPEQKHLSIQLVDKANRTIQAMWHIQRVWRPDPRCLGASRGEGVRAVAALHLPRYQKVLATTPRWGQGVIPGSNGCSLRSDMLGITSVPLLRRFPLSYCASHALSVSAKESPLA